MRPFLPWVLVLSTSLLGSGNTNAQIDAKEPTPIPMGAAQMSVLIDPYWKSNTTKAASAWETLSGVKGSMFFNEDWINGYVRLKDSRVVKDIPLRFNVYTNEIFFKADSQVLVIGPTLPVVEFGLDTAQGHGSTITVFRSGYPAIGSNTGASFYECIVSGNLSLLKHRTKRISERSNFATGPEKVINDTESWYVYDSTDNKMTAIKHTKSGLIGAFPQYADKINSTIHEKGLKLSSDEDWIVLFSVLK